MNKEYKIAVAVLVVVLIAMPIAFQSGKSATESKYDQLLDEMRQENTRTLAELNTKLVQLNANWERKQLEFEFHVRETLLVTGVTLETLNQKPASALLDIEAPDTPISQATYSRLRVGMSYDDVIDMLGREGENTLNMLDADGSGTSSYVWRWVNDDKSNDSLTVTFVDLKLSNKHFSAFKL